MDLRSYAENIYIIPILIFSVVIHEMAHAWVALKCGDTTAKDLGRITLNPIPHIDLFGSILVPLFSIIATGRVFIAWAKPVPIDPRNFRSFKRDDTLVTIAGPISNLLIAFLCVFFVISLYYINAAIVPAEGTFGSEFMNYMIKMFYAGIILNVSLAVFNMIPIPPLDGSHVLANLLPDELAFKYRNIGFMGIFIILALFNFVPGFTAVFVSIISFVAKPYLNLIDIFIP
ncbi:MAG: site-2 protease family protein [Ignavibacteria bacterium]|nr:site-2 protease family protein [Ignavibacteria bacterium]MCC7158707.1 site-2 protease family protein [Ignavibacteria bacterium]